MFCDTSALTTLGYSLWMFGRAPAELAALAEDRYDAVILCCPDFPFVQDGTRRDENFRRAQHDWYLGQLAERDLAYVELGGALGERIARARQWLGGRPWH